MDEQGNQPFRPSSHCARSTTEPHPSTTSEKMTTDIPSRKSSCCRPVSEEGVLDVLHPLHLNNMAAKGKKDSSFVTFTRTESDFPPVKRVNQLDKKRILVTGVSTIDCSHCLSVLLIQRI